MAYAQISSRKFRGKNKRARRKEVLDIDITIEDGPTGSQFFEKLLSPRHNNILGLRLRIMHEGNRQRYVETVIKCWATPEYRE